jgi:hypothetical protein
MSAGLLESAQRVLAGLLDLGRTRFELFGTELREDRRVKPSAATPRCSPPRRRWCTAPRWWTARLPPCSRRAECSVSPRALRRSTCC